MDMFDWFDESYSRRLAQSLIHCLWQGSAVAAFVVLAGRLLKQRSAQLRYIVNVSAILLMAACLPTTFILMDSAETASDVGAMDSDNSGIAENAIPIQETTVETAGRSAMPGNSLGRAAGNEGITPSNSDPHNAASSPISSEAKVGSSPAILDTIHWLSRMSPYLSGIYLLGVLLMTVRLARGIRGTHQLRRKVIPVKESVVREMIERQARRIGLKSAPLVGYCKRISIPIVIGILRPVILLPAMMATGLTPVQLRALVTHELAHIRRFDLLVNLLQRLIEVVLFFHPAVWFVSRRISAEREHATDDAVLAAGSAPIHYADALVRMAELSTLLRGRISNPHASLAAAGSDVSELKRRVLRLLGHTESPKPRFTRGSFLAVTFVAATLLFTPWIVRSWADNLSAAHMDQPASPTADFVPGRETRAERRRATESDVSTVTEPKEIHAASKLAAPSATSWGSFRNGHLQQGVAGCKLPRKLELLWKVKTVHGVVATAAIVGEHVYVPTLEGRLFCFQRQTGKTIWTYRSVADATKFAPGVISAPTVTADTVFVGDEDGVLHAVDRKTGKLRWTFKTGAEIPGGVQVVDGNVIFGSHDSFLYCLDAKTGKVKWKYQTQDRINCAPAIVRNFTFVSGCDEHLRRIDFKTQKQVSDYNLESYIIASPAVMGDFVYVGGYKGEFFAYNWKTNKIEWRFGDPQNGPEFRSSAAVTESLVVVGASDKKLHCLDRKTGLEKWNYATRAHIKSSPAIVDNRVFFGSEDRNMYCVQLSDGKPLWKFNAGSSVTAGPAIGEGVMVFGGSDSGGFIYCFGKKSK